MYACVCVRVFYRRIVRVFCDVFVIYTTLLFPLQKRNETDLSCFITILIIIVAIITDVLLIIDTSYDFCCLLVSRL